MAEGNSPEITPKVPTFLKEFSKEQSPLERTQKAQEIKAARKEADQTKKHLSTQLEVLEAGESTGVSLDKISTLKQQLVDLSEQRTAIPRQLVSDFYQKEAKKWQLASYSRKNMEKYFSEEHLESLSLPDYILLLQRFPSEMVTHVTRQGIRDHIGHMDHTEGQDQYSDGFMQILNSGKLAPAASIWVDQQRKDIMQKFLGLRGIDKQIAIRRLKSMLDTTMGKFGDTAAVHFALEEVADAFYGAERGNEFFVVFPTPFIASQTNFYRSLTEKVATERNDVYVWPNQEQGLNINAGIVFIPKDVRVDPKTGSKYEIDNEGTPVVNQDYVDLLQELIPKKGFIKFAVEVYDTYIQEGTVGVQAKAAELKQQLLSNSLKEDPRTGDERVISAILTSQLISDVFHFAKSLNSRSAETKGYATNRINSTIKRVLSQQGIYFKEAPNTIPSKDFWEDYFTKNPQLRPSKIVYYEGADPSKALLDFKGQNNLSKKGVMDDLGFPEHRQINYGNRLAETPRGERFKELALETIEEYYSQQAAA